ncbi:MAG: hypothetical protein ACFHVJ_06415 [Aestuariibacter sp.]
MKFTSQVIKAVTLTGALLVGSVSAYEVTLKDMVSHLVQQAVTDVSYDIANGVYASIVSSSYHIELQESEIKTEVIISQATETKTENTEKAE